jgi:hypothetical protein
MPIAEISAGGNGVAFLVSAGIVYEIIAAACSSPQTAEINAVKRSETLMKWVHIGSVQSALFVGIAAYLDPKRRNSILIGGVMAWTIMYGCYFYANKSGLASGLEGTEDY